MIQKVAIFYFSGTGTTQYIATQMAEALAKISIHVELIKVEDVLYRHQSIDYAQIDMMGIAYPVHAFDAPEIIYRFVRQLPVGEKKKVFTFRCAAGTALGGGPPVNLRKVILAKGYTVIHEDLFILFANLGPSYSLAITKKLLDISTIKIRQIVSDLTADSIALEKTPFWLNKLCKTISLLESQGAKRIYRHFKKYNTCAQCNVCVNICPTQNISLKDNLPQFQKKCLMCLRCIYYCPKSAITISVFGKDLVKNRVPFPEFIAQIQNTSYTEASQKNENRMKSMILRDVERYIAKFSQPIE